VSLNSFMALRLLDSRPLATREIAARMCALVWWFGNNERLTRLRTVEALGLLRAQGFASYVRTGWRGGPGWTITSKGRRVLAGLPPWMLCNTTPPRAENRRGSL
jgi:hypothetical protein